MNLISMLFICTKRHNFYQVDLIFLRNLLSENEIKIKKLFLLILAIFHVGGRKKSKKIKLLFFFNFGDFR
jgi:hypothetical protein